MYIFMQFWTPGILLTHCTENFENRRFWPILLTFSKAPTLTPFTETSLFHVFLDSFCQIFLDWADLPFSTTSTNFTLTFSQTWKCVIMTFSDRCFWFSLILTLFGAIFANVENSCSFHSKSQIWWYGYFLQILLMVFNSKIWGHNVYSTRHEHVPTNLCDKSDVATLLSFVEFERKWVVFDLHFMHINLLSRVWNVCKKCQNE